MTTDLEDVDFARLIGDRDVDICKLIERMSEWGIAQALCRYARDIIKGRWPEAELYIMKDPVWAYCYARDVVKDRWIEAEPCIKKNPGWARLYSNRFEVEL